MNGMKSIRRIVGFTFIALLISLQAAWMAGAEVLSTSFSLQADTQGPVVGDTVSVTLKVNQAKDLYSFDFMLKYDNATYKFTGASLHGSLEALGDISLYAIQENNAVRVIATKQGEVPGISGDMSLVQLKFQAVSAKEDSLFRLEHMAWSDSAAAPYRQVKPAELGIPVKVKAGTHPLPPPGGGGMPPAAVPPAAGFQPILKEKDNKVAVDKLPDGRISAAVAANGSKLAELFGMISQLDQTQRVLMPVADHGTAQLNVQFTAVDLADMVHKAPEGIISIQSSNKGSYDLPLKALRLDAAAKQLGVSTREVTIQVTIEQVDSGSKAAISESAEASGLSMIGQPLEYAVTAEAKGSRIVLQDFNGIFIERRMHVTGTMLDTSKSTGVLYDPVKKQFQFVPTFFETVEGVTQAVIQRSGNSIYTLVQMDKSFEDLNGHWAKEDVQLLANKLVVAGVSDVQFAPDSRITRAQFTTLLARSLGLKDEAISASFTDVSASDWFAGPVAAAVRKGLVDGYGDGSFKPDDEISREQMAVMISKAMNAAGKSIQVTADQRDQALLGFSDSQSISSWAAAAAAQAVHAGIMNGMNTSKFAPQAPATRAQAAVILKRMLQSMQFIN